MGRDVLGESNGRQMWLRILVALERENPDIRPHVCFMRIYIVVCGEPGQKKVGQGRGIFFSCPERNGQLLFDNAGPRWCH